jgi:hypothetical protein
MQGTVQDFLNRFGSGQTVDDRDASQYYDRFASQDPRDADFDCDTMYNCASEYLGKVPDNEFQNAAQRAYEQAPPQQRQGLIGSLLGSLQGRGTNVGGLAGMLGLGSTDPQRMNASDYARLANYTRREHPEAMRQTVREQPGIMKALGNPFVAGTLAVVAAKMMNKRRPAFA